jgi:glycosyltransferase involved in cell wall biosynthesis
LRILLVSGLYPPAPGGVSDYTCRLAHALAAAGNEVGVLTRAAGTSLLEEEEAGTPGGQHQPSPRVSVQRVMPHWGITSLRHAVREARLFRPDAIGFQYVPHMYGRGGVAPGGALLPLALRMATGAHVIGTLHEMLGQWSWRPSSALQAMAHRVQAALVLAGCHQLVVTNARYARYIRRWIGWLGRPAQQVHEIPVGANILPSEASEDLELRELRAQALGGGKIRAVIGDLGPFSVGKRPRDLLEVLRAAGEPARLLLLGAGPDHPDAASFMREAMVQGSAERVEWGGFLESHVLSATLKELDVYVHTQAAGASTRSTALIAALAHGLPVVAYRGVETAEVFVHRQNVYLAPEGDSGGLAEGVRTVLSSPETAARLRAGARSLYERAFSWPVIAHAFLKVATCPH